MRIARTIAELQGLRLRAGVLVPTMGSLHAGHASLMRLAHRSAPAGTPLIVSIFVNPTQFNDTADFERYPRSLETDADLCASLGVDAVFAPEPPEIYPPGREVPVGKLPAVATRPGLEDAHRPGHFAGVCQVVRRLFAIVEPRSAVFGEKDWQQLQVVRAMVGAERLGVEIVPGETVREGIGLAMSSRNSLLGPSERAAAHGMPLALEDALRESEPARAEAAMLERLERAGLAPEYAVVRDAETLLDYRAGRPGRALVAARAGAVRLIDNSPWPPAARPNG